MSSVFISRRRLLPRWRQFSAIANLGELNFESKKLPSKEDSSDHIYAIGKWEADNSLENAIELCSSAIVQACFNDAHEAAIFILDSQSHSQSIVGIAKKVLKPDAVLESQIADDPKIKIAVLRKRTHKSPSNPIFWIDMALAYSALGQNDKAERSVENALILAPHNRFVVRCAARFFVHINKASKAHQVVKKYRFLKNDAWVLAVELSISSIKKNSSKYIKLAKNVIEKSGISPFHSSELASALGVVETEHGANRKAVKLFKHSLIDPTGNSIAQAQWSKNEHKLGKLDIDDKIIDIDLAHEARAYKCSQSGDWDKSIQSAEKWFKGEPYSTFALSHMSYISCVCQDDHAASIKYNEDGLKLNKDGFIFLNNITVSHAQLGQIEDAEKQFNRIKKTALSEDERFVYTATRGMLAFKRGNTKDGRELYIQAIANIGNSQNIKQKSKSERLALLFFAREEILAKTSISKVFFDDIKKKIKDETGKDILALKSQVEKLDKKKHR